ncbi:MAG: hypothetical protein HKN47_06700 [Pirellulaceae bacterium]|nr:hypothetical protein [Pirellulaceae bacterium]
MKNFLTTAAFAILTAGAIFVPASNATAQDAILAEIYGRGVHALSAGQHQEAYQLFSTAIDNGSKDPRVYYFRGIVNTMLGNSYDAQSDWEEGAKLEASVTSNPAIGRSLSRFQGSGRLKLEQIRQTARLQSLTSSASRSDVRRSQIQAAAPAPTRAAPAPPANMAGAVAPPPAPPAAENPFGAGSTNMAAGQPKVEADDALEGTMGDPFKDDGGGVAAAPAGAGGDPFGGGDASADAGADPFGGAGGADADPFGGGGDAMADPFGGAGDPFGN